MKIEKNQYLEKINYIEKMLDDDNILNEYITSIEDSKFEIPTNIVEIIKLKIDNEKSNSTIRNNYQFLNILKVACFSLVVMIIWTAMTNISFASKRNEPIAKEEIEVNNVERENKISTIYGKVNDFTNSFSSLLLSPVEIEGGER